MVWMAKSITSSANEINIMQIKTDKYDATEEKEKWNIESYFICIHFWLLLLLIFVF